MKAPTAHVLMAGLRKALEKHLEATVAAYLKDPPPPETERNVEGMTFQEWLHAAVPGFSSDPTFILCLVREWERGLDPSELRKSAHPALQRVVLPAPKDLEGQLADDLRNAQELKGRSR